jgi:hypothetical protein
LISGVPGRCSTIPYTALHPQYTRGSVYLTLKRVVQHHEAITYKNFLTLWKDADPDVPILKQAKSEYAKLQQVPVG